MSVSYQSLDVSFNLKNRRKITNWIKATAESEGYAVDYINVVFTSDEKLLEINKEFLQHDFYTDIITFDYTEGSNIAGDLMISVERVKENSIDLTVPFLNELHRVIIHGVLHLCGYKDKTNEDEKQMRNKENIYLEKFGIDAKI